MTAQTPTTPPAPPRQRQHASALAIIATVFGGFAALFALIGIGAPPAAGGALLFGAIGALLALIDLCIQRTSLGWISMWLCAGAFLVGVVALAVHPSSPVRPAAAPSYGTYPTSAPYVIPTTAYTPPSTYTPAPVYAAPTTTETTTTQYTPPPPPKPETYTYRVTGPPVVSSVTYATGGSGNAAQDNNYRTPWHRTVKKDSESSYSTPFAYVSAQNAGGGSISCSITDDSTGQVISQNTSNGEYAIVTCSN